MKKINALLIAFLIALLAISVLGCQSNEVILTFVNSGSGETLSVKKNIGDEVELDAVEIEGYEFKGWYLAEDFSGQPVETITASKDTTFYAKYIKLYSVTLELNYGELDGESGAVPSITVGAGDNLFEIMESYAPLKDGYQFGAWFYDNEELTQDTIMPESDITLTAKYKISYTVEIYLQSAFGGEYTKSGDDVTGYGYAGTLASYDEELEGYTKTDASIILSSLTAANIIKVRYKKQTPSAGVIVIIDRSGSMGLSTNDGTTFLSWAKVGAIAVLETLSERDYFGLMTLDSTYNTVLSLTQRTNEGEILEAISSISNAAGTTNFVEAIRMAGTQLKEQNNIEKRHIVIISDGVVPDAQRLAYENIIESLNFDDGITLSVVGLNMSAEAEYDINTPIEELDALADNYPYNYKYTEYQKMLRAAILGGGRMYTFTKNEMHTVAAAIKEDFYAKLNEEV